MCLAAVPFNSVCHILLSAFVHDPSCLLLNFTWIVAELLCCCLQLLYDTFSAFGMVIATPKIMRDPDTGASRGFGFVSFDGFEASDAAIEAMNGQYLCNR